MSTEKDEIDFLEWELLHVPFFLRDAKRIFKLLRKISNEYQRGATTTELSANPTRARTTIYRNLIIAEKWGLIDYTSLDIGEARAKPRKITKRGQLVLSILSRWDRDGWPTPSYPMMWGRPQRPRPSIRDFLEHLQIPDFAINRVERLPPKEVKFPEIFAEAVEHLIAQGGYTEWLKRYFKLELFFETYEWR